MGKASKSKAEKRATREAEQSKGWKIDIRPYKVMTPDMDEKGMLKMARGRPVMLEDEFDVQGSLADILFNRDMNLKAEEAFEAYDVAKKIRAAKTHVVLDSKEMSLVRRSYEALRGVSENMVEFCRRIKDAEEIQLGEVKDVAKS